MNKPYFAKLLPVPGKVGSGDMFQFPGMPIKECIGTDDGLVWYEPSNPDVSDSASCDPGDCQRMVMHLCSRNAVDYKDKITLLIPNYLGLEAEITDSNIRGSMFKVQCAKSPMGYQWLDVPRQAALVIGLISPAACWVKEGDEFDEEQLQRMYASPVRLISRAGERKDAIYTDTIPSEAQLKEAAEYWLEMQHCNYCTVHYGEEPTVLYHVKIKCPCCNRFA